MTTPHRDDDILITVLIGNIADSFTMTAAEFYTAGDNTVNQAMHVGRGTVRRIRDIQAVRLLHAKADERKKG